MHLTFPFYFLCNFIPLFHKIPFCFALCDQIHPGQVNGNHQVTAAETIRPISLAQVYMHQPA